jgi:hypothetical protein
MPKEPPKRFNNGHKTHNHREQKFLTEIYDGERRSCDKFSEKIPTLRRPRDPIQAEDTPRSGAGFRPTTDLYMPASHFPPPFNPKFSGRDQLVTTDVSSIDVAETLHKRKVKIDAEIQLLHKQIAYKKSITNR